MTDWQSDEEIAAHVGPGGPVEAVRLWLEDLVITGRFEEAWDRTDPEFRRQLVAAWVNANRDHPVVAGHGDPDETTDRLTTEGPAHPLWGPFAPTQLDEFQTAFADYDEETWGSGSRPRIVAPGVEIVYLAQLGSEVIRMANPTPVRTLAFYVRRSDSGWLIAGFPPPVSGTAGTDAAAPS